MVKHIHLSLDDKIFNKLLKEKKEKTWEQFLIGSTSD